MNERIAKLYDQATILEGKRKMFINPNPDCQDDCSFVESLKVTTLVHYPPVYDKHGNNTNPDRNWTSYSVSCHKCNTTWNVKTNGDFTEINKV